MIETGRVTVPTDVDVIDATIEIINRWKADAIRDCDGTDMPEELRKMDIKQYATYYTTRKDNAWAKANPDEIQQMYLMSDFVTARDTELKIQIMQHFYKDQLKPNTKDNHRWWEVIDRTTDDVITNWDYDEETGEVIIHDTIPYHAYTVSFLAFVIWDPVHMYNALTNDWQGEEHQMTFDVRQPKTQKYVLDKFRKFCEERDDVDVVRFTTFFHQFTLQFDEFAREKFVDWFGYSASVSPYILEQFEKEVGYPFRAEYIINKGFNNSTFCVPTKEYRDFMDFQQREVSKLAKKFVDISSSDTRFVFADNGNVLETNRTGEYRASYTFEGARYYSPRTIFMNGTNFSNTRAPYISGPATTEYGDKATLTVKLNDNADWPAVSEYTLICRGQPSGARISNSSVSNTTGKFTIDELFFNKAVTKENFVPGEYTFEAKVRHADGVATSRRFVLTYEKTNIDYVFLVNGEQAEFNDATGESRYTLPTDCNGTFNVENGLYPRDSTKLKYPEKDYTYSIKNLTPETITFADGTATVLSPGDAKLNLEISKKSDGSVVQTVPLTVTIPIIGFEVSQPDYNAYLGQKWEDVRADVKSVWGPGERKVTTGTDKYLTVSTKSLNGAGLYDTVDYNGKADITWTAKPNTGYRFAMKILESGYNTNGKNDVRRCLLDSDE